MSVRRCWKGVRTIHDNLQIGQNHRVLDLFHQVLGDEIRLHLAAAFPKLVTGADSICFSDSVRSLRTAKTSAT